MILNTLAEIIWNVYQDGRPNANEQKLNQSDIIQMCRTSASNNFRQQYLFGQKIIPGKKLIPVAEESEFYFVSPLLAVKRFPLTDADNQGMRRADMSTFDLYRLPKNAHIKNIYMVNNQCDGEKTREVNLVQNGEERFYLKPKFKSFQFATIVGRGLNTYNVPPCVENIDVETTFDNDNVDISMDIAFDVTSEVLGIIFRVEESTGEMQVKVREEIKKREELK